MQFMLMNGAISKACRQACGLLIAALVWSSCSDQRTDEPPSIGPNEQFERVFQSRASSSIEPIEYTDYCDLEIADGSYCEWMTFGWDAATFARIVSMGYQLVSQSVYHRSERQPLNWPKQLPETIYMKRHRDEDTGDEDYVEFLWRDLKSSRVCYQRTHLN